MTRAYIPEVLVARTGTANLASVFAGLRRVGAAPRLTRDADEVREAAHLVLPGVGAFGAAMDELRAQGLVEAITRRLETGRPTLAICLGLQVLAQASEETPGVAGLGIVPGVVRRFSAQVRVPQLGWNRVDPDSGCRLLTGGEAYFANSYRLETVPEGWRAAWTEHGGRFVAALERGPVLACQFHPELSGAWGLALMRRWLEGGEASLAPPGAATLKVRVIPCLDCRDGRVVKGVRFSGLRDSGDPAELAAAYELQGADELVVLDISATPEGRATAAATVRLVRERLAIPLTVGGGVRSADDAGALLEAGADKVAINTAAVRDPGLLTDIARRFGSQCAVLGLDAASRPDGGWEVVVLSGRERTGIDVVAWAQEAVTRGAGEILLTSWDRDGTRAGYDLDLIREVSRAVHVPVIASGGADAGQHLLEAVQAGADAVLAASIFHEGDLTVGDVKRSLAEGGVEVRR